MKKTKVALVGEDWDLIDLIENHPELEMAGVIAPTMNHPGIFPYLGKDEDWQGDLKVILGVDIPATRKKLFAQYGSQNVCTLISPQSYISKRAQIGHGSLIQRGVTISAHVNLGLACKININACIHHDVQIDDFCTIAPQALLLGHVVIEEGGYIGAGAIIKQRCRIGKGATIGAGAVVVKDVPAGKVYAGVPAKELKTSNELFPQKKPASNAPLSL